MKKILVILTASLFTFGLVSCGGKKAGDEKVGEEEVKTTDNPVEALANMGKEMEEGNAAAEAKLKERRAKGDTLAMKYAELIKYLPETINGYKREEPSGGNIDMPGASYANAEANYTNDKGDNIKVQILDYNAAAQMYASMTSLWAMGMTIDNTETKAGGLKLEGDIGGWEQYEKKARTATVTLGVGYRFWIQVDGSNQDNTEFIKSVAKSMDLKKLAAL